ncbi:hypothetical protein MRB53_037806 [Persea americana]|nr:hypothetical protein MRB53_037806 [Persea americana]
MGPRSMSWACDLLGELAAQHENMELSRYAASHSSMLGLDVKAGTSPPSSLKVVFRSLLDPILSLALHKAPASASASCYCAMDAMSSYQTLDPTRCRCDIVSDLALSLYRDVPWWTGGVEACGATYGPESRAAMQHA